MADYWKSQPRKFCQYCKCWIADNKPSVEFHERGKNHKENVAAKIAEIKKKSVAKAKQEQKMSKDFAAMEEAALKAYEEDLKRLAAQPSGECESPALTPAPAPAPAPAQKQQKKPKKKKPQRPASAPSVGGAGKHTDAWLRGNTDDGQVYYYNTLTGESQWEKPYSVKDESLPWDAGHTQQERPCGGWMEAVSPDGYTYYYNTQSGESSWEKPDDFSADDISPPGVDAPQDVTGTPDDSSAPEPESEPASEPTSEPVSEPASDSPKDTAEADEPKQSGVSKISFRKKREEPSPTPADDGGSAAEEKQEEQEKPEKQDDSSRTQDRPPVKRARKSNPYGAWEQIQPELDPYEAVDLQLPQETADALGPAEAPPEPRSHFKERTITSLGDEAGAGATFRRRKTENGKARSLRQRDTDD